MGKCKVVETVYETGNDYLAHDFKGRTPQPENRTDQGRNESRGKARNMKYVLPMFGLAGAKDSA